MSPSDRFAGAILAQSASPLREVENKSNTHLRSSKRKLYERTQ